MRDLEQYFRPESPEEAVELKQRYGAEAVYLGGGSDLMVHRPAGIRAAIDIRYAGISEVRAEDDWYVIGGAALLCTVEREAATVAGGMLRLAVRDTAPWLIRNAATLAGNLANASPAADSVPALIALDAQLELLGNGAELAPADSVLAGPHRTTLGDRLIRTIRIPRAAGERLGGFIKLARSKSDICQANVAVAFRAEDGVLRDIRIALGAVAPTAIRARGAEALLEGRSPNAAVLRSVQEAVCEEVQPISDWRASADYRRRMSGVIARRALEQAMNQAGIGVPM